MALGYEEITTFPGWPICFDDSAIVSLICQYEFAAELGQPDEAVFSQASNAMYEQVAASYRRLGILDRIAYYEHDSEYITRGIERVEFLARQLE